MHRALLAVALFVPLPAAAGLTLTPVAVAEGVYAVVGDPGGQTYENDGLNANLGFVIGDESVLVVNSGPSVRVAQALHTAIRGVTNKPVKWVVNVNSQNHYWHGNEYFMRQGAKLMAHKEAVRVMRETGPGQLEGNRERLKDKAAGTTLAYPDEILDAERHIALGKIKIVLRHFGAAHTPGDLAVWLPQSSVVFSGDIVYTERLLAVIPISDTGSWLKSFDAMAALQPKVIVPGHGKPTDLTHARRETRDYLAYLRGQAKKAFDGGVALQDFIVGLDQSRFKHLANFDELARRNANLVYLEIEKESF